MTRRAVALLLAVAISAVLLQLPTAAARQKQPAMIAKEDIHNIQCQVCMLCAEKLGSECVQVLENLKNVCKRKKQQVVEKDKEGHYDAESKTVESACKKVMEFDTYELLMQYFCKDLSRACAQDPTPVPKGITGAPSSVEDDEKQYLWTEEKIIEMIKSLGKGMKGFLPKTVQEGNKVVHKVGHKLADAGHKVADVGHKVVNKFSSYWKKLTESGKRKTEL